MSIFHLSVKTVSRAVGRSATAAAAYRAAVLIADARTGEIHDYRRKGGVEFAELVLPVGAPKWASDRTLLWNAVEQAETRKNSTVAREFEIALPAELSPEGRRHLALQFACELVARHKCAADVALHAPGRNGDIRNYHAHILLTTRRLSTTGFTEKTRELDQVKTGEVTRWRERFASLQNEFLREAGLSVRVDHRSLEAQGCSRPPNRHLGPAATAIERRTGGASCKRLDFKADVEARLAHAAEIGRLERLQSQVADTLIALESDLLAALRMRDAELGIKLRLKQANVDVPTLPMLGPATGTPSVSEMFRSRPADSKLLLTYLIPSTFKDDKYLKAAHVDTPLFLTSFFEDIINLDLRNPTDNDRPKY